MKTILTACASVAAATAFLAVQAPVFAADHPYLIGLIAGTTGAYGSTGVATVNGAQMAVDKINASGGVLGRQFKLDPHNDDASATVSGQLYEKLIAAGAIAIAGSPDTGPVTAQLAIRKSSRPSASLTTAASRSTPKGQTGRRTLGCSTSG